MISLRLEKNNLDAVARTLRNEDERMARGLANYIRDKAKGHAPVDTGNLRDRIRVTGEGNSLTVLSDTKEASEPPLLWSTQRNYAYYTEYGSVMNPAQPYMTPAAMEGKTHAKSIGKEMGRRVETTAKTGRVI